VSGPAGDIDAALRHCRDLTRRRARNFYCGLKLAPEPKRTALYVLYAWMRRVDDIVDDEAPVAGPSRSERLLDLWRRTESALAGERDGDEPLWTALTATAQRFALPAGEFFQMISGQIDDLEGREYETWTDLEGYCRKVASSVGLLCLSVWGAQADATAMAIDRGVAFQLTNILRDYAEDYDRGRVYLPAEDFHRFHVTPHALRIWSEDAKCRRFAGAQIERAAAIYRRSEGLEERVSPDCAPVLWAMTRIYASILDRIGAGPRRAFTGRPVRLSLFEKGRIGLEARRRSRAALGAAT
jgi:phytoene synthase